MNVWIGHYRGNPNQWFVVWAKTKEGAYIEIDNVGEPDMESLIPIKEAGLVNFQVKVGKANSMDSMRIVPPRKDVDSGMWLNFGEGHEELWAYIFQRSRK